MTHKQKKERTMTTEYEAAVKKLDEAAERLRMAPYDDEALQLFRKAQYAERHATKELLKHDLRLETSERYRTLEATFHKLNAAWESLNDARQKLEAAADENGTAGCFAVYAEAERAQNESLAAQRSYEDAAQPPAAQSLAAQHAYNAKSVSLIAQRAYDFAVRMLEADLPLEWAAYLMAQTQMQTVQTQMRTAQLEFYGAIKTYVGGDE